MKVYEFSAKVKIREKYFETTIKTSIEPYNSLYLCIEQQSGLSKTTIFIKPFTPQMLDIYGRNIENGFKYHFSGNNIGFINLGGGNADGVWDSWDIKSIEMNFIYYRDRVNLKFSGKTDRGSSTWLGSLDEKTKNKHEPFTFDVDFFISIDEFSLFIEPEKSKIDPEKKRSMLIEQLKESAPQYINRNS